MTAQAPRNTPTGPEDLQAHFEDSFEHALVGYVIADAEGRVIRINPRLAGWLGQLPENVAGRKFSDLLTIAGKVYYETHLWPLLRMQGFFDEIALDLACQDGARFPVMVNGYERRDDDGHPLFIRIAIFKAADRRRLETNLRDARTEAMMANTLLRELNATLGQRVAAEVKDRLQAEDRLSDERHSSALREQFIAVLGHDLRNPLASIDAGMRLLSKAPLDDRSRTVLAMVGKSVDRMSALISDVMDFARGRLGAGIGLALAKADLQPILEHVVNELRTSWPDRDIRTTFAFPEEIVCDPARISQLVSNLVANALTHGATGGTIDVQGSVADGLFQLSVSNPGEPIAAPVLERLFEPFTRNDVMPAHQGLGLGLYICSEIARAHGGSLRAASSPAGTTFTFTMPLLTDDARERTSATS